MIYDITPMPAPRLTRNTLWTKRARDYAEWKRHVRLLRINIIESGAHITFHMPMPESWSKASKVKCEGKPHQSRPDVDNLAKALLDAMYKEDAHIWDVRITKLWAYKGAIEIN